MSRYTKNFGDKTLAIGWDIGMNTFFAQVSINQADDDLRDLPLELWLGGDFDELTEPADFERELAISGYELDEHIRRQLQDDRDNLSAGADFWRKSQFKKEY